MTGKNQKILTVVIVIVLAISAVLVTLALKNKRALETPATNNTIGMGTVVVESFYNVDSEASKAAISESTKIINDLDNNRLSWRKEGSDIWNLNKEHSTYVDFTTFNCISTCFDISSKCDGAFDITVGELSGLWNIGTKEARVPSDEEIDAALPTINFKRISLLPDSKGSYLVEIGEDQKIDLGAVGKGLACDKIRDYLETTDIYGGTVSVGGSILVYGKNPTAKDNSWNIAVRDPFGSESDYMAVINCKPCCISTSGDYEKTLIENGKVYHHILDPKTGYPAKSNVTGVTIVCDSGVVSDALSTACFILGYSDKSLELLKEYNAEAIFITKTKEVYITDGLKDSVTIVNEDFHSVTPTEVAE
ncbi:MAG: FAD:protein FMN transferase [Clostridia bacterium]|nr:FAD:protein FMN transferase [Clostridia bacterium]